MESIQFVEYCGKTIETTVTNKSSVAENWMQNVIKYLEQDGTGLDNRVVGVGCKFLPGSSPVDSKFTSKIATLQLCVDNKCLVLQLLHMDYIPLQCFIRDFFRDSKITFVGVEAQALWQKMMDEYAVECSCRMVDVHLLAKAWFPISYRGRPSLKAIAYGVAGLSMRKSSSCDNYCRRASADWGSKILDEELVQQACVDAYASYKIAHKLWKDL